MKHADKYMRQYFLPPSACCEWVKKDYIEKPPIWCSVDLRDGNQALIEPMNLDEKMEFYQMLLAIGFKEIEVSFPAASNTEFQFVRKLIEEDRIPDDVTVQVLTQSREHIIRRTFEAMKGVKNAVIHLYGSTSAAQREQVLKKTKEEIKQNAVESARLFEELAQDLDGNILFEYSPESFHGTEVDFAAEVCNAVLEVWRPRPERKVIINIPSTVETAMPHVFARQIEYMNTHLNDREHVILSIHPHNDRGCGVAAAELGVLAGADRVEGTLFGNGERTGNVDLVTVAMNMYSYGIDPCLDFSDMPSIVEKYERLTRMAVSPRSPYSGNLVFTAFSGSHQDAIAKGMEYRENHGSGKWTVPYLPIDPKDVGRTYDSDVIRVNSQSGKGGVNYVLKNSCGISLPQKMRPYLSELTTKMSDENQMELTPEMIYQIFMENFVDVKRHFAIRECHFRQENEGIRAEVTVICGKSEGAVISGFGNGRLDAVSNAVMGFFKLDYDLDSYEQHALTRGSAAKAIAYVSVVKDGKTYWGAGIDDDIIQSSCKALEAAVNRMMDE